MQVQGIFWESGASETVTQPGALAQDYTVKDGAGKLFHLDVVNTAGADRFVYVFDNNADSGDLLVPPFKLAAGASVTIDALASVRFSTGLNVASSSTQASYTAAGSDFMIRAVWK